ncbi:hypothetical protein EYC59_05850 [Candidatus Saccharibacteria bacterium]|nr:MAG: hypothetical protein EYC59_05850 [Candidatus Saccharibacteria bacterium]
MVLPKFGKKGWKEIGIVASAAVALLIISCILVGKTGEHHTPRQAQQPAVSHEKPFEFPAGGRTLLPNYRFVALYGTPGDSVLGVLGAQDPAASVQRAKDLAAQYQPYATEHVYPTFEIITTVAAGSPTQNGDYSQEIEPEKIEPWIRTAKDAGVYVVLDLQPGRSDFLSQAKQYQKLLEYPNVGLALDPEWRLTAAQMPMKQIGSVAIDEVNTTLSWLADMTSQKKLPQKLVVLHQFRMDMLPNRERLDTSHAELAYVIQMDGQGAQTVKLSTWRTVTASPPANTYFGWKNFYAKDNPVLDPAGTMALEPKPWYVSYQ